MINLRHEQDALVLILPDDLPANALREQLRAQLPELVASLGGRPVRIDLGARDLELFEIRRLLQLLREPYGIEVMGLFVLPQALHRYAERELKLNIYVRDTAAQPVVISQDGPPPDAFPGADALLAELEQDDDSTNNAADTSSDHLLSVEPDTEEVEITAIAEALTALDGSDVPDHFEPAAAIRQKPLPMPDLDAIEREDGNDPHGGRPTLMIRRTLRSGTEIRYDHDVVVLGDLNAGATIRAGGNVMVLGHLRGVAHAGAPARHDAFVLALSLQSTQVRIGTQIAITSDHNKDTAPLAEIAIVRDGQVIIEPYQGRWPR